MVTCGVVNIRENEGMKARLAGPGGTLNHPLNFSTTTKKLLKIKFTA